MKLVSSGAAQGYGDVLPRQLGHQIVGDDGGVGERLVQMPDDLGEE